MQKVRRNTDCQSYKLSTDAAILISRAFITYNIMPYLPILIEIVPTDTINFAQCFETFCCMVFHDHHHYHATSAVGAGGAMV